MELKAKSKKTDTGKRLTDNISSRLLLTVYRPLERFVPIQLLGKSVDRVGIVITSVIVKKDFLLLLGILGPSPMMRSEIKGDAGNGI